MRIDREQYQGYLAMQGLSDNTIRVYSAAALRWCDWAIANRRDPYQPDPLSVRAWSKTVNGTRSSLAHARAAVGHWCRACEVEDVSAVIPLPRRPSAAQPLLDHRQTVRLLAASDRAGEAGLAVKVALYTAGRRSEVASLAWSRVDFDRGTITLQRPKVRDLHTVPLHPALALELHLRWTPDELWVFAGRYGGHVAPAQVWEWIREVGAAAGLGKVTPTMLRRTCLTEINDSTRDLRAAQLVAGHTDPAVTATYTRVSDVRMAEAIGALQWVAP